MADTLVEKTFFNFKVATHHDQDRLWKLDKTDFYAFKLLSIKLSLTVFKEDVNLFHCPLFLDEYSLDLEKVDDLVSPAVRVGSLRNGAANRPRILFRENLLSKVLMNRLPSRVYNIGLSTKHFYPLLLNIWFAVICCIHLD